MANWLCPDDENVNPFSGRVPTWLTHQRPPTLGSQRYSGGALAGGGDQTRSHITRAHTVRDASGKWYACGACTTNNAAIWVQRNTQTQPPWSAIKWSDAQSGRDTTNVRVFGEHPGWVNYAAAVALMRMQAGLKVSLRSTMGLLDPTSFSTCSDDEEPECVCRTMGATAIAKFEPAIQSRLSPFSGFVDSDGNWWSQHGSCDGSLVGTVGMIPCPSSDSRTSFEVSDPKGKSYTLWTVMDQAPKAWYDFVFHGYSSHIKYWKAVKEYCAKVSEAEKGG
jgi:hypothetical protein